MDTQMKPADFRRYLGVLYFGTDTAPPFQRYVNRAYRDLSRTLHTDGTAGSREARVDATASELSAHLTEVAGRKKRAWRKEADFDRWHDETCAALIATFGGDEMCYGHAQKWVNMSLKYLFTASALKLDDIGLLESLYPFAHMPIDNIVLDALAEQGFEHKCPRPWSKLGKDDYLAFQNAVRSTYKECPMDVEFMLWRGSGTPTLKS